MRIIETAAKEIFTRTKLEGAKWVINPYVGCGHGCLYCYAKFMAKWRPKDYGEWGSWVEMKINGPQLVQGKRVSGWLFMSSICDPYQPVEKDLRLTRKILENMDKNIKLSILTKSDLILRDLDILKKFKNIEIGLTVNSFISKAKKLLEPEAPENGKRIAALERLKQESLYAYAFVSPIIPGLTDLRSVIAKTQNFVDYYWFEFLNWRGAGRGFTEILKKEFPKSYAIVSNEGLYKKFISESKNIINGFDIKIRGVVEH
ncbi:MAG: radical SAM protein [Candidatus Pacebacteria bacterium]|nr:radical SAM protein [Candidatus Paceibacterota bacterium]